ncbi:MAG: Hsp20/alpha crystallin family protein [Saprospiraceae bacterium]|nr:Hsp20/alpha crystallin family protein [Saprospiraceae bacterium]
MSQNDQSFDIKLAILGYNKADVSITLDENKLIVKGSKSVDENVKYLKKEFNFTSFERVFTLPENVKNDQIEANTNDGILHIIVPKTEVKAPVNISVK